jgi:hypothetical protein
LETNKILEVLADHPQGMSVAQLCEATCANRNTIISVLQRHRNAIDAQAGPGTGQRGRPEKIYSIREDWLPALRGRWAQTPAPDALEDALGLLESASFAAIDTLETPEDRERMTQTAQLHARVARRLVQSADAGVQGEALRRIERAEQRVATSAPLQPAQRVQEAATDGLELWWERWVRRVGAFAVQYGSSAPAIGGADPAQGLALVLDCIPAGPNRVAAKLVGLLREHATPTISVSVANLSVEDQAAFVRDFETLALDPIARRARLFVTMDSQHAQSAMAWSKIQDLGAADHATRAIEVAAESLKDVICSPDAGTIEPAVDFHTQFMNEVMKTRAMGTLWHVYGTPEVLDIGRDKGLQAMAQSSNWAYHWGVHASALQMTDKSGVATVVAAQPAALAF